MSISYFVGYRGQCADPERFFDYHAGAHAGILAEFPGIRLLAPHRPAPWRDPFPVNPGDAALMARMSFDLAETLDAELASEARKRARDDFSNFPEFQGTVSHQATQAKVNF